MMRYSKEIVNQIKIIDEVLYSLNLPSILKNEYLVTDAINCENYLKLHYNKPNNIFFSIVLNSFGVQIDIDEAKEILDLSLSSSKEEKNFKEFIKILFTSFIRIKKYGKYYIKITFFNQKRECIKTIRYIEINSFSLNFKATLKEYPPLYLSW